MFLNVQTHGDDETVVYIDGDAACQIHICPSQSDLFDFMESLFNKLGPLPMEKRHGLNMYEFQAKHGLCKWWSKWSATSITQDGIMLRIGKQEQYMGCAELQIASHLKLEHILLTSTIHEAKLVYFAMRALRTRKAEIVYALDCAYGNTPSFLMSKRESRILLSHIWLRYLLKKWRLEVVGLACAYRAAGRNSRSQHRKIERYRKVSGGKAVDIHTRQLWIDRMCESVTNIIDCSLAAFWSIEKNQIQSERDPE